MKQKLRKLAKVGMIALGLTAMAVPAAHANTLTVVDIDTASWLVEIMSLGAIVFFV